MSDFFGYSTAYEHALALKDAEMAKKDAEMNEIKAQMAAMAKIINCIQQPTDGASASAAVTPTSATRGRGRGRGQNFSS